MLNRLAEQFEGQPSAKEPLVLAATRASNVSRHARVNLVHEDVHISPPAAPWSGDLVKYQSAATGDGRHDHPVGRPPGAVSPPASWTACGRPGRRERQREPKIARNHVGLRLYS